MSTLSSRDFDGPDESDESGGAQRLWLSDQQWMTLLSRVQRGQWAYEGPERRDTRRNRFPTRVHCVVRTQQPDGGSETYLLRSHNISAGGLGFIHTRPLPRGSRCTIALHSADGEGLIAAGRVAWARQLEVTDAGSSILFEVGIQFDRPIDPMPFLDEMPLPPSA